MHLASLFALALLLLAPAAQALAHPIDVPALVRTVDHTATHAIHETLRPFEGEEPAAQEAAPAAPEPAAAPRPAQGASWTALLPAGWLLWAAGALGLLLAFLGLGLGRRRAARAQ